MIMIALLMSYQVPYSIILYILTMIKSIALKYTKYYFCIWINRNHRYSSITIQYQWYAFDIQYITLSNKYSLIKLPLQTICTLYLAKENYRYPTRPNLNMVKKNYRRSNTATCNLNGNWLPFFCRLLLSKIYFDFQRIVSNNGCKLYDSSFVYLLSMLIKGQIFRLREQQQQQFPIHFVMSCRLKMN